MTKQQQKTIHLQQVLEELRQKDELHVGEVFHLVEENNNIKVATNYDKRQAVGGIARGKFLVMIPTGTYADATYPHFILLRRVKRSDSPDSGLNQIVHFDRFKKKQPINNEEETSDVNHSVFECSLEGAYSEEITTDKIRIDNEPPDIVDGINYSVYAPDQKLLDIIFNCLVLQSEDNNFRIGRLREMQAASAFRDYKEPIIDILLKKGDFIDADTAILGKNGFGKSNFAKTLVYNMRHTVGQLIFDAQGEYCNPNPQDEGGCIADMIPDSVTYGISYKEEYPGRKLINPDFYKYPKIGCARLRALLKQDADTADYVMAALADGMDSIEEIHQIRDFDARAARKVKLWWGILYEAGFEVNEESLDYLQCGGGNTGSNARGKFALGLSARLLRNVYRGNDPQDWDRIDTLQRMIDELRDVYEFYKAHIREHEGGEARCPLKTDSGNDVFDNQDINLFKMLFPQGGRSGPQKLRKYKKYHQSGGGDGSRELLRDLEDGRTVFLAIDREDAELVEITTKDLSQTLYNERERIFNTTGGRIKPRSILIYYEEAQDLFPKTGYTDEPESIYVQLAKKGRKLGIGVVYLTQDPTAIDDGVLTQTKNWFAVHISSERDLKILKEHESAFEDYIYDLKRIRAPGYARIFTRSSQFVMSVQVDRFIMKPEMTEAEEDQNAV